VHVFVTHHDCKVLYIAKKAIIPMFIMTVYEQFTCFEDVHSGIFSVTVKFNGISSANEQIH